MHDVAYSDWKDDIGNTDCSRIDKIFYLKMLYNQFKSILISTESSALLIGRQVTNHYFYPVLIDHAGSSILKIHVFFKKIPRGDK